MPLPAGVSTFTLTGDELNAAGGGAVAGLKGHLAIVDAGGAPLTVVHLASGQELLPDPVLITVAADGTWSVPTLPFTDQAGLSAVGFQFRVWWDVPAWGVSPGDKQFSVPVGSPSPVMFSRLGPSPAGPTVLVPVTPSVPSVNGRTGPVTLAKGDVGLGNVDNTSDTAKPVSTAQQAALDAKAVIADIGTAATPTGSALRAALVARDTSGSMTRSARRRGSMAGDSVPVNSRAHGYVTSFNFQPNNGGTQTGYTREHIAVGCSDLRLVIDTAHLIDGIVPDTPVRYRAGLVYGGVNWPVTWGGRSYVDVDGGNPAPISDPVGITIPIGGDDVGVVISTIGPGGSTTLAVASTSGTNTLTLNGPLSPGKFSVELPTSGTTEVLEILSCVPSATAGQYTATTRVNTTKSHALSAPVQQYVHTWSVLYAELSEGVNFSDAPASTSIAPNANVTTTLSAAASIGDTRLQVGANLDVGTTITVESETLTVDYTAVIGAANYVYLTGTVGTAHASGVTVTYPANRPTTRAAIITADNLREKAKPTTIAVGDSLIFGQTQMASRQHYLSRATGGPVLIAGKPGEQLTQLLTSGAQRRMKWYSVADIAFVMMGTNDLNNSRTAAQVLADLATLRDSFLARGQVVVMGTVPPRTTSTDNWATTANQTVITSEAQRTALNDGIRAMTGVFVADTADALETGRNSGKWGQGAKGPLTGDGVHMLQPGGDLLVPVVAAAWSAAAATL